MIESLESRELFSADVSAVGGGMVAMGPLPAHEYAAYLKTVPQQQQQSPKEAAVSPTPTPPAPNKDPDREFRHWYKPDDGSPSGGSSGGWLREDLREDGLW